MPVLQQDRANVTTLYDTLQVSPGATADVIQSAYRALARTYHPDINPSAAAARRMQEINAAYAVLNDPDLRAQYDARRARQDRIRRVTRQDGSRPSAGASATATPSPAPPQTAGAISSSEPTALILTACPRLGFKDDSFHHFARPTQLHACYASGRGNRIPIYEQRVYCLQRDFIHCPRWLEASQKPASAKGQGATTT